MKKILFLAAMLAYLLPVRVAAQPALTTAKHLKATQKLTLKNVSMTDISADTSLAGVTDSWFVTARAIKAYVLNHVDDFKMPNGTSTNQVLKWNGASWQPATDETGGGGGAVNSVNTRTGDVVLTKSDVGLSSVDNTTDLAKPISTATQTALNAKQNTITGSETAFAGWDKNTSDDFSGAWAALTGIPTGFSDGTDNVNDADADPANEIQNLSISGTTLSISGGTGVTLAKANVGLSNVDNTTDAAKPISTATQTALNAKQNTLTAGSGISIVGSTISATGGGGGSSPWTEINLGANFTSTQNASPNGGQAQNITGLTISGLAIGTYWIEATLLVEPNSTGTGGKFAAVFSGAATHKMDTWTANTSAGPISSRDLAADGSNSSVPAASWPVFQTVRIAGKLTVTAPGDWTLRVICETTGTNPNFADVGTITVLAGSQLRYKSL